MVLVKKKQLIIYWSFYYKFLKKMIKRICGINFSNKHGFKVQNKRNRIKKIYNKTDIIKILKFFLYFQRMRKYVVLLITVRDWFLFFCRYVNQECRVDLNLILKSYFSKLIDIGKIFIKFRNKRKRS